MISPRLFRALGWCWLVIGLAAAPFVLIAWVEAADAAARGFMVTAGSGVFAGGLVLAASRGSDRPARAAAGLRLALYGWATTPLLAAPPLAAAAPDAASGVFEAYSALTTTGASVLDPSALPASLVLWRAVLQGIGGFATLILAVTVFAALESRGPGFRRSTLLTVEDDDLFTNFGRAARRLGALYAGLILIGALGLMLAGATPLDALCLSLSALSTGGMTPQSGPLSGFLSPPAVAVVALLSLLGAWSFAVQYELVSRGRATRTPGDLRAMLGVALVGALAAAALAGPPAAWAGGLEALFAITTAGFDPGEGSALPPVALLALALAGGSAVSTAGGVKMPRILLLMRRAADDLSTLAHPSAAGRTRFAGRAIDEPALASVTAYAVAYPVALGFGALALGLAGLPLDAAWSAAAAGLANAGPVAELDYSGLPSAAKLVMLPIMIAGRLEVLALAAAIFVILKRE